jgi:hypothetical protein
MTKNLTAALPARDEPRGSLPALTPRIVKREASGGIFAFVRTLRLAVRARVVSEQSSGVPFAEIVVHVREMVKLSEASAGQPGVRPSPEFRAIAKQADVWCIEAYRSPETAEEA